MSRRGAAPVAAVLIAASLAAAARADGTAPSPAPSLAGLSAIDPDTGERVALDLGSAPTHVAFFATWCRPCLDQVPGLFDLEDRWRVDGYRLLMIALPTRQTPERLKRFRDEGPIPGRLLLDADGSVSKAFEVGTIPSHALVDREGRIVARAGVLDASFREAVERLVRQEGRAPR